MTTNQWDQYADLVDERIGVGGDTLHTSLIDPLIRAFIGDTSDKTVVDFGCGNGYIYRTITPKQYIGIDVSRALLKKAADRIGKERQVSLYAADIGGALPDLGTQADVVICNMVLQYVPDIVGVAENAARLLKKGGICVVIVDHPAHALFVRAQALAGKANDKFIDLTSYFAQGKRMKRSLWGKAELLYYHRTVASYVNAFTRQFTLDRMDELSEDGEMPRILGLLWRNV